MAETFEKRQQRITAGVGVVEVRLVDVDGTTPNATAIATAEEVDADGNTISTRQANDIRSFLTAVERQTLWALMQKVRAEAIARLVTP